MQTKAGVEVLVPQIRSSLKLHSRPTHLLNQLRIHLQASLGILFRCSLLQTSDESLPLRIPVADIFPEANRWASSYSDALLRLNMKARCHQDAQYFFDRRRMLPIS